MEWPWDAWKTYQRIKDSHNILHRLGHLTRPIQDDAIEITNLRVRTNIKDAKYVLVIDGQGSPGMQHPIGVDGYVKCIICTERAANRLVCASCEAAVHFMRALSDKLTMNGLREFNNRLEQLDKSGLFGLLNLVTVEFLQEWVKAQAEDLDAGPDDAGSVDSEQDPPLFLSVHDDGSVEGGPGA